MSSETLHEDSATLGPDVIDQHRAIASLMEELEAVDWYNQRAKATTDPELRAILEHNRDEEKEHAAMVLEWLRRSDAKLDEHLQDLPVHRRPDHRDRGRADPRRGRRRKGAPRSSRRQPRHRQPARHGVDEMNHLFRESAPITAGRLGRDREGGAPHLAGAAGGAPRRRLQRARWAGGRPTSSSAAPIRSPRRPVAADVQARLRRIQPLVELRIPFEMSRAELDAIDRGARDPDLDNVTAAAREIAIAEDRSIFHGYKAAHITGICQKRAERRPCRSAASHADYPLAVATALTKLRDDGIEGPVRGRAERAALQGPRRAHRQRLSDHQPRPAPDRRRRSSGRPASTAAW